MAKVAKAKKTTKGEQVQKDIDDAQDAAEREFAADRAALEAEADAGGETPGIGHNSGDAAEDDELAAAVSNPRLKSFIERVERLEEEKRALAEDIRDVYGEAKAQGFEPKIMRRLVTLRKKDLQKRREEEALLDLYMAGIGMAGL